MSQTRFRLLAIAVGVLFGTLVAVGAAKEWPAGQIWLLAALAALALALGLLEGVSGIAFGPGGIEVQNVVAEARSLGGSTFADELERSGIAGEAATYAFIHRTLTRPEDREVKVRLQDTIVESIEHKAFTSPPDRSTIEKIYEKGSPAARVVALGLVRQDPSLMSANDLADLILHSKSANEQYHALVIAQRKLPALNDEERTTLFDAVREAPHIHDDSDRAEIADQILDAGAPSDSDQEAG
jgi:hypothetical protein